MIASRLGISYDWQYCCISYFLNHNQNSNYLLFLWIRSSLYEPMINKILSEEIDQFFLLSPHPLIHDCLVLTNIYLPWKNQKTIKHLLSDFRLTSGGITWVIWKISWILIAFYHLFKTTSYFPAWLWPIVWMQQTVVHCVQGK